MLAKKIIITFSLILLIQLSPIPGIGDLPDSVEVGNVYQWTSIQAISQRWGEDFSNEPGHEPGAYVINRCLDAISEDTISLLRPLDNENGNEPEFIIETGSYFEQDQYSYTPDLTIVKVALEYQEIFDFQFFVPTLWDEWRETLVGAKSRDYRDVNIDIKETEEVFSVIHYSIGDSWMNETFIYSKHSGILQSYRFERYLEEGHDDGYWYEGIDFHRKLSGYTDCRLDAGSVQSVFNTQNVIVGMIVCSTLFTVLFVYISRQK